MNERDVGYTRKIQRFSLFVLIAAIVNAAASDACYVSLLALSSRVCAAHGLCGRETNLSLM